jgi:hypothetical protein
MKTIFALTILMTSQFALSNELISTTEHRRIELSKVLNQECQNIVSYDANALSFCDLKLDSDGGKIKVRGIFPYGLTHEFQNLLSDEVYCEGGIDASKGYSDKIRLYASVRRADKLSPTQDDIKSCFKAVADALASKDRVLSFEVKRSAASLETALNVLSNNSIKNDCEN